MTRRWCSCCGKLFDPRPQAPRQAYCTQPACQRFRKRLWQKAKRKTDADYIANQAAAHLAWSARQPEYSRQYRLAHPAYTARNREQQKVRNQKARAGAEPANLQRQNHPALPPGVYELRSISVPGIAKMVVCRVELRVISEGPEDV